jgi:hypothetical protein
VNAEVLITLPDCRVPFTRNAAAGRSGSSTHFAEWWEMSIPSSP